MLRKVKKCIWKQLGVTQLLQNQKQEIELLQESSKIENEILKATIFNSTIVDSEWLKNKSFSPGGWAVDYSFLYTLYRVLEAMNPISILEFGLGQSSKLVHQYGSYHKDVEAVTVEHDSQWVDFFQKSTNPDYVFNIKQIEIEHIRYKGEDTLSYKNIIQECDGKKYDLIIVDAPFGSKRYSRSQILDIAQSNLASRFCIIIDDYNRFGEQETGKELMNLLDKKGLKYVSTVYFGSKKHLLLCSEDLKFLTSL